MRFDGFGVGRVGCFCFLFLFSLFIEINLLISLFGIKFEF